MIPPEVSLIRFNTPSAPRRNDHDYHGSFKGIILIGLIELYILGLFLRFNPEGYAFNPKGCIYSILRDPKVLILDLLLCVIPIQITKLKDCVKILYPPKLGQKK